MLGGCPEPSHPAYVVNSRAQPCRKLLHLAWDEVMNKRFEVGKVGKSSSSCLHIDASRLHCSYHWQTHALRSALVKTKRDFSSDLLRRPVARQLHTNNWPWYHGILLLQPISANTPISARRTITFARGRILRAVTTGLARPQRKASTRIQKSLADLSVQDPPQTVTCNSTSCKDKSTAQE